MSNEATSIALTPDQMRAMLAQLAGEVKDLRAENRTLRNACAEGWGEPALINTLRAERDHARAKADYAFKMLAGVHALLYPAPVTTPDGRTMVFRPTDPDPHAILQRLSDRIRALPAEIEKAATAENFPTA